MHNSYSGGILIEFAFSIPILILLLFFTSDHYRIYELKDKLRASAYLTATMIQQLSNTRENKQLTHTDLARIAYASCLNLFHTNSMFYPWPLGIFFAIDYTWVKRIDSDKYYVKKSWATTQSGNSPSNMTKSTGNAWATTNMSSVELTHSDLICHKDGDERLLIECFYRPNDFNKTKFGLFIIDPKFDNYKFVYRLVITPKPGLFPVKD